MVSPSNAQLKLWRSLTTEKGRRKEGLFLAEGGKVVEELLRSGRSAAAILCLAEALPKWEQLLSRAPAGVKTYLLTVRQWKALSQDQSPEGVMAVVPKAAGPGLEGIPAAEGPLLLLYRIGNPNNLGAVLRTADWFGFSAVVLSAGSCEATNPKAVRASMGSIFRLTLWEGVDFLTLLPRLKGRFKIIGSDPREGLPPSPSGVRTALILGSESHGLPAELLAMADERWRIPGSGRPDSLSLPQAAAVMMYECNRGCLR